MKLTKESFSIMEPDEYYWDEGNVLCFSEKLPLDDEDGKKIIKQILENQEKLQNVHDLVSDYYDCHDGLVYAVLEIIEEKK